MHQKYWLVLFLLIVVTLGLRLFNLGTESLWTDEAFSVNIAQESDPPKVIERVTETEAAPPGYYLFLHYWMKLFGNSDFSVRLPSVLFGTLSVLVFSLIIALLFDRRLALLASLFMSTAMLQVLYSQEARLYSLFTFLVLLSTFFFFKLYYTSTEKKLIYTFLYILTLTTAFYVNYLAVFLPLFYTLQLLWRKKAAAFIKQWLITNTYVVVLSFPLLRIIQAQFTNLNTGLSAILLRKGVPEILAFSGLFFFALPFIIISVLCIIAVIYKDALVLKMQKIKQHQNLFFLFFIAGYAFYVYALFQPLIFFDIPLTSNPLTHSYFLTRHPFFLFPLIYLFLSLMIINSSKKTASFLIYATILINLLALSTYYTQPTKAEWQELGQFLGEHEQEIILLDKGGFSNTFLLERYTKNSQIIKLTSSPEWRGELEKMEEHELLNKLSTQKQFWLILARNPQTKFYYRDLLDKNFQRDASQEFYQIKAYHYQNHAVITET